MLSLLGSPVVNSGHALYAPVSRLMEAMHSTAACKRAGSQLGCTTGTESQTVCSHVGCPKPERPTKMQL